MDDLSYPIDAMRELERRLEAYADARLSLSLAATIRLRTAVLAVAHRQAALVQADATFKAADATWAARDIERTRRPTFWQTWRRPMAAVLAGVLTLGLLTGTAWSVRPGGPLYAARIWTEMANLPPGALARADAQVRRLQLRIDEAEEAVSDGDGPATEAALTAYTSIVVEAADNVDGDPAAIAAIEMSVEKHVEILSAMVARVPVAARPAVENAILQSGRVLNDLGGAGSRAKPTRATNGRTDHAASPPERPTATDASTTTSSEGSDAGEGDGSTASDTTRKGTGPDVDQGPDDPPAPEPET